MALKRPREYWEVQEAKRQRRQTIGGAIFIVLMVVGAWTLYLLAG